MDSNIKYEVNGRVAVITINRPEKMNALSLDDQFDLDATWIKFKNDEQAVVGIIIGSGDRAFCVGADLKDTGSVSPRNKDKGPHLAERSIYPREYALGKPVIAAINGHALGMGAALVMQSDLRIISNNGAIGYPLVRLGMMPGALHDFWMASPSVIAMHALYTGKSINSEDAYRAGIVNQVVKVEEIKEAALSMANEIAKNAPLVIRAIKDTWDGQQEFREIKAWRDFSRFSNTVDASADREEGRTAYRENRTPNWENK
jgi:E-phenylitaconyl-CoA hydratase